MPFLCETTEIMPHVLKKEYKYLWHKCRKSLSWGVILLVSLQDNSKERVTYKRDQQPLCGTEIPSHRKEYMVLEKTKRTITKQGTLNL